MRRRSGIVSILFAVVVFCAGCTLPAPYGDYPDGCSGVPGDDTPPPSARAPDPATHGPTGQGRVIELAAIARPPWDGPIPLLYAFDERASPETRFRNRDTLLIDPVFVAAESEAYWYEGLDDGIYEVPELGSCDIAAMLGETPSFRAPAGGLLFFQFVVPECDECEQISAAIERVISDHPALPVRWVRITVPRSVGTLREE